MNDLSSLLNISRIGCHISNVCINHVLLELCRGFCTVFYCSYFCTNYKKTAFSKIRVVYNNVYRKILCVPKRRSASTMFVSNGIPNFEALIRKSIFSFNSKLQTSCNRLICTIEQSWIMRNVIWKTWDDQWRIQGGGGIYNVI